MSDQTKTRFTVDLGDLERQLRQTAGSQPKARSGDPLADLARIVGQDDPFKSLFADKRVAAPSAEAMPAAPPAEAIPHQRNQRIEPSFAPDRTHETIGGVSSLVAAPDAAKSGSAQDMLDEFDRLLQSELRGTTAPAAHAEATAKTSEGPVDAPEIDDVKALDSVLTAHSQQQSQSYADVRDLDDLSRRIRADENIADIDPLPPADYPEPPEEQPADLRSLEPQQPRKGLVIAGVMLGIAALGLGAVVGLRNLSGPSGASGEPPVIKAEAGPSKVQPENPGGVEIPNQNKQIYERTPEPKPGESRVVTREEQPMDVQATARTAARVILPGPGGAVPSAGAPPAVPATPPTTPAPAVVASVPPAPVPIPVPAPSLTPAPVDPSANAAALGEPRRVRTIAVRPDGTVAPPNGVPTPPAPVAAVAPRPTPPAVTSATPVPRPPAPRVVAADEAPALRPTPPRTQVAAAPATAPAPRATEPAPAGGGFMVQLGAPGSESEARSTFASLQRRFADQLGDNTPVIRRADVGNGRTVYRLRVGPFSREEAAEKCQALQAAGGQCFIARN